MRKSKEKDEITSNIEKSYVKIADKIEKEQAKQYKKLNENADLAFV
ncbi:hypothetical protein [Bacillus wiedmannii]|nr:hypothetical protein [Bacillus wiedmannii]MCU5683534.1 hypothetical protein [Bacillus wiedmannii]MED2040357.1 hypothetical protein [Bacillus wiedmannii]